MPARALLTCSECSADVPSGKAVWSCPACGSLLELRLDPDSLDPEVRSQMLGSAWSISSAPGIWAYGPFIPVDPAAIVSLGEGNTPILPLQKLGGQIGLQQLYAKLEYVAPTGSFKDRGATALVSKARALRVTRLVEDSSGNAGASIAAYCARAGIGATIYVPASAPEAKKAQIALYGAEVVAVAGTREEVTEAALERCRREGAYYGSHNWNPYFLEGTKTFAYEVAAAFDWNPPEHLVMPVGNGSLYLGAWKGFGELQAFGVLNNRAPRLHVAQATACMPIVDAFERGLERTAPVATRTTVAGGISIARPSRGRVILRTLRESGGSAAAVSDDDILTYQRLLASLEGIFCEPTSAAAFAALPALLHLGAIRPQDRVLVAITGIGLKDPDAILSRVKDE